MHSQGRHGNCCWGEWNCLEEDSSVDGNRTRGRRGGRRLSQSVCPQNGHGFPLSSLHHTVPHSPASFPQTHANLICNICEDEETEKLLKISCHCCVPPYYCSLSSRDIIKVKNLLGESKHPQGMGSIPCHALTQQPCPAIPERHSATQQSAEQAIKRQSL